MIDPQTQQRLREKYNPDGSQLRQHQMRMVEMLEYFDKLCRKHNIRYWLSSGNCIGVARHGGFIPWDDDIDVEMLREDYLKLEKVFTESDRYVLQTRKNDPAYFAPYAKMRDKHSFIVEDGQDSRYRYRGIYIDIFQMEYTQRSLCRAFAHAVNFLLVPLNKADNIVCRTLFAILKPTIYAGIAVSRTLFGGLKNNKLRHTYGSGWINNIRNTDDIFPLQRAKFEHIEVSVPNDLDSYLRKIYGDYMQLPPEDKIQRPHIKKLEFK